MELRRLSMAEGCRMSWRKGATCLCGGVPDGNGNREAKSVNNTTVAMAPLAVCSGIPNSRLHTHTRIGGGPTGTSYLGLR